MFLALLSVNKTSAQAPAGLAIQNLVVSDSDGGEAFAGNFGSGERVFLRFTIGGARAIKGDDEKDPRMRLRYTIRLADASQILLAKPLQGEVVADLAPEDKKWQPRVNAEVELPTGLVRGQATVLIELEDQVAVARTSIRSEIGLGGPVVAEDAPLTAADFQFLRQEDDKAPLNPAAYRAGDTVWARFSMIGFTRGEGNRYAVSYGLEAFGADGASLFRQEVAAEQQGDSSYPRRYLPSVLSLQLTKDLAKGEYLIRLHVLDTIGGKRALSEHRFTVE